MTSFSAETLLAIFYQYPRDILQEIAAQELYNRDWRWHIKLQQWMMKDPDLPAPIRLSPKEERGWYLFFDVNNWRRERVCALTLYKTVLDPTSDTWHSESLSSTTTTWTNATAALQWQDRCRKLGIFQGNLVQL